MKNTALRTFAKSAALFSAALLCAFQATAQVPDYQTFKQRYQQEATTPEGAVKMYFEAALSYINESTRAEGSKMLRYAMHESRPLEQFNAHATFMQRLRDPRENHVIRSFAAGATPENNYEVPPGGFSPVITGQQKEADYLRVLLQSGGADSPRAVWVKEFDGLWYTINNAGTYAQVRPPKSVADARKNAHDADHDPK